MIDGGNMARVLRDKGGVIALMFGIIYGPLIAIAFLALTLNLITGHSALSEASDDAGLIAAALQEPDSTDRQKILDAYWSATGASAACGSGSSAPVLVSNSNGTTLSASTECSNQVGGLTTGYYPVSSTVQIGISNLEVAMVLDNTGSMAWGVDSSGNAVASTAGTTSIAPVPSKMSGLKVGVYDFLAGLAPYATSSGLIKVAVVPMANDINICTSFTSQNYCDGTTTEGAAAEGIVKYYNSTYTISGRSVNDSEILAAPINTHNCTFQYPYTEYSLSPIQILSSTTYVSNQDLNYSASSPPCNDSYTYTTPSSPGASNWLGCVVDRDQLVNGSGNPSTNTSGVDYDISDALPTANSPFSLYPADNINCGGYVLGPVPIVPLTDLCVGTSTSCTGQIPQSIMNLLYCRNSSFISGYPDTYCANYAGYVGASAIAPSSSTQTASAEAAANTSAMIPNGGTDLTIGLAWGLNMLTPKFPLSSAGTSTESTQIDKVLILFTDGFNSLDRFNLTDCTTDSLSSCYANGSNSQNQEYTYLENMNTETTAICQNIRQLQLDPINTSNTITVYTIGTSDADSTLLLNCAGGITANVFTGLTADKIATALQSILSQIVSIRVSQ